MSTKILFGDKEIQLPGSYSRIISGQSNPEKPGDYSVLMIIDNNKLGSLESGILGGAGVNGELKQGIDTVYSIKDITEFKNFVGRGWWYKAADFLFNPDGQLNGVSEIKIIKPATTKCANLIFNVPSQSGSFILKSIDESDYANGVTDEVPASSVLTISNAGTEGLTCRLKVSDIEIGRYVTETGDTIADIVTGLVASITALGIGSVTTSNATTITFTAPKGMGTSANAVVPIFSSGGTAAGTATAMSGGISATKLYSGYAYSIETGIFDTSKYIMKIWRGSYTETYSDGIAYNEINQDSSKVYLVAKSPEVKYVSELIDWAKKDKTLGKYFVLDETNSLEYKGDNTDGIEAGDVLLVKNYWPAINGSAVYDSLEDALEAIKEVYYNKVVTTYEESDPNDSTNVLMIKEHLLEAKYSKRLVLYGDDTDITTTKDYAVLLDSSSVEIVHGGILKKSRRFASGFRTWNSFFHMCAIVGRILGLRPEVPVTFKSISVDGLQKPLSEKEKLIADSYGILTTVYDNEFGKFIVLHDVNTNQDSEFVLNDDGTSHLIQIERIKAQLDYELVLNSKKDLLSNPNGINRNSLTIEDAEEWTKAFLSRRLGNLIVEFKNVKGKVEEDYILIDYEASPNTEIKGLFFTGHLYI